MGTKKHAPRHDPPATGRPGRDAEGKALGGGIRPGTKSRLLEARERAKKRG